jgi:glycerol uptake facilitator-like aquaporin
MALAVCLFNPRNVLNERLPKPRCTALFTVGVAYGLGIVVALVVCTATSGGHFSPGVTLVHFLFNAFPPAKAIR